MNFHEFFTPYSSLIDCFYYFEDRKILEVHFKIDAFKPVRYKGVSWELFEQLCASKSIGKFYNTHIKTQFKTTNMAEDKKRPKGTNKAKKERRFIEMQVDVTKLNKNLFTFGDKGQVWADLTLIMLPDGEVDKYDNLGMVVQKIPGAMYKELKKENKQDDPEYATQIVANGRENLWEQNSTEPKTQSQMDPSQVTEALDDLPF